MRLLKYLVVGMVVLVLSGSLVGCGVAESDYEALQIEYDILLEENAALQMDLEDRQGTDQAYLDYLLTWVESSLAQYRGETDADADTRYIVAIEKIGSSAISSAYGVFAQAFNDYVYGVGELEEFEQANIDLLEAVAEELRVYLERQDIDYKVVMPYIGGGTNGGEKVTPGGTGTK